MKVAVHLVSLPWAPVFMPSITLGCLKAYVDEYFKATVPCFTYSAFIEVLINALGDKFLDYAGPGNIGPWTESISQLVYFEEFKNHELNRNHRKDYVDELKKERKCFSISVVHKLQLSLKNYIKNRILPNLKKSGVNIIGLSMNMQQSYLSAFLARYLHQNYPGFQFVFLFGGSSASSVGVAALYADEGVPGFFVIGEGEGKLTGIIETIRNAEAWTENEQVQIVKNIPGVLPVSQRKLLYERNIDFYKTQADIESLPDPDHQEYFDTLKRICRDSDAYDEFIDRVLISLEGSRGCFARCDFCASNQVWSGFRKRNPKNIVKSAIKHASQFNCNKIHFVDTVCDPWASDFAEELIQRNIRIPAFMELRAGHTEAFWTKLALCGAEKLQIGAEALSPSLLRAMNKGTTVAQNIVSQKYLKELNVESSSTLITNHPKSTVEDVSYTKNVLSYIPHLDNYTLSDYFLISGSPLYLELSDRQRRDLKKAYIVKCKGLYKKSYLSEYFYYPETDLHSQTRKAWNEFIVWYNKRAKKLQTTTNSLDVIECSDEVLWVRKVFNSRQKDLKYNAKYAAVYEICHQSLSLDEICDRLKISETEVTEILKELSAEKLMIEIEGVFISLALRKRELLIQNFYKLN